LKPNSIKSSNPLLAAHLKTGRLAHTYLFTGPEGAEKQELVNGFARSLNCEKETIFESCDCRSCRKTDNRNHPDVHWLGEDEKARSIKIEEIRDLIHQSSLKPYEGKRKVFILKGAERLTLEAANALLKTLEEPPLHSIFVLSVENKAHLLQTIQSRACEVRSLTPPEKNPLDRPAVQAFHEKGIDLFFAQMQTASRPELVEDLEALMFYLRDQSAQTWDEDPHRSEGYLKALERVYETQEAVDANVNQKLALTYLEIQLGKLLR